MSGTLPMSYFHMSPSTYVVGDEIFGNGRDKVDARIEDELEKRRPDGAFPRRGAVYCLESTDFTTCGVVSSGYIYQVVPSGEPQRRDFSWIGEMQKALLRLKYTQYERMKEYPEWSPDLIEKCCSGYWNGEATNTPGWEYLTSSCTVVEVVAGELIDPKSTNGGWRPRGAIS
ncbi:MAG: hypothetical protein HWE23_07270 [Rhodobacteraceae bacterium]|nr:hypothetical protein [Paracoccaceae bacterium]